MKRVAITGISGYIGNQLLQNLDKCDEVESIIGLSRTPPRFKTHKLKFFPQSVREPFADVFVDNGVDSAVHLAFVVPPAKGQDAYGVNIRGTQNFLEACSRASVKNVMYLSSHTVYGPHLDNPIPITEGQPLRPIRGFPYSWDKAQVDRMFQDFMELHGDKCVTILRCCTVVGPHCGLSGFTVLLTPVMVCVMGYNPPWQFVHETDLADLLPMMLMQEQRGIFNVGGEGFINYREIIAAAKKPAVVLPYSLLSTLVSLSWWLKVQSKSPIGGLEFIKHPIIVSTEKLERTIGFKFRHTSRDALMSFLSPTATST